MKKKLNPFDVLPLMTMGFALAMAGLCLVAIVTGSHHWLPWVMLAFAVGTFDIGYRDRWLKRRRAELRNRR